MKLFNVKGQLVTKNVSRQAIKWNGESKSKLQFQTKQFLKPFWSGFICYEEFPVYGTRLKVDLLNASLRIAIEVNGPQHSEFHYFHNKNPALYLNSYLFDAQKIKWLNLNKFKYVEINFDEVPLLSKEFFREKFGIIL